MTMIYNTMYTGIWNVHDDDVRNWSYLKCSWRHVSQNLSPQVVIWTASFIGRRQIGQIHLRLKGSANFSVYPGIMRSNCQWQPHEWEAQPRLTALNMCFHLVNIDWDKHIIFVGVNATTIVNASIMILSNLIFFIDTILKTNKSYFFFDLKSV